MIHELIHWSLSSDSITDHSCVKHNNIAMAMMLMQMHVRSRVNMNIVPTKLSAAIVFSKSCKQASRLYLYYYTSYA